MRISIIAAMSENRVIGLNNQLPWRLPADLKRFKQLTLGHTLVMGRKTYESIGHPLPGRATIVITRQNDFAPSGVLSVQSVAEALTIAQGDEVFIAGGEQIYRQTIELADRIYLTVIEKEFAGDAFFPEFDLSQWQLVSDELNQPGETFPAAVHFLVYERR